MAGFKSNSINTYRRNISFEVVQSHLH